jgi:phosphate transport system substrate-binding protein
VIQTAFLVMKHAAALFVLLMLGFGPAAAEVRIHGATTVTYGLIKPHKDEIEKKSGAALDLLPSSTTRGLTDLAQGRAEIAMLAEPLETAADSVNKKQPGTVDTANLIGRHVGNAYVQFIVHHSNPLQKLDKAQLAGLFSGRVKNWSEIGGADQAVLLVGEPTSSPHKLIANTLAISYPPELRVVQNTNQTAVIVAQAPGALSYLSTLHDVPERNKLKVVDSEIRIPLALYLAYRKDAPEEVNKVVEAAASLGSN